MRCKILDHKEYHTCKTFKNIPLIFKHHLNLLLEPTHAICEVYIDFDNATKWSIVRTPVRGDNLHTCIMNYLSTLAKETML